MEELCYSDPDSTHNVPFKRCSLRNHKTSIRANSFQYFFPEDFRFWFMPFLVQYQLKIADTAYLSLRFFCLSHFFILIISIFKIDIWTFTWMSIDICWYIRFFVGNQSTDSEKPLVWCTNSISFWSRSRPLSIWMNLIYIAIDLSWKLFTICIIYQRRGGSNPWTPAGGALVSPLENKKKRNRA